MAYIGTIPSITIISNVVSPSFYSISTTQKSQQQDNNHQLIQDSVAQLAPTMLPNGLYVLFGFFAVIFSSATMYVIFKAKRLRTKFFTLLLLSTMVDLTLGISYASLALKRYYRFYGGGDHPSGEGMTVWNCFGEVCVNAFSLSCSLSSALALVVDRLFATIKPLTYKQTSQKRITLPLIVLAVLFALIQTVIQLIDAYLNRDKIIISCSIQTSNSRQILQYLTIMQICASCSVVLLNFYLGMLIKLKRKKMTGKKNNINSVVPVPAISTYSGMAFSKSKSTSQMQQQQQQQQFQKQQDKEFKIFKTLTLMTVAHAVMHLGGRIVYSVIVMTASDKTQILVYLCTQSLVVLNAAVHFFLLSWTSSDFRNAANEYFWNRIRQNSNGHQQSVPISRQQLAGQSIMYGQSTVTGMK